MCTVSAAVGGGFALARGYAQHQGQRAAYNNQKRTVRAQRRAQRDAYNRTIEQQNREWNNTLKIWNQRVQQYHAQVKRNNDAAYGFGGAYMGLQVRTNEKFTEAAFQNQAALGKLYKTLGAGAASGQSGRSVDRFDVQSLAAFGREQAAVASNLTRTREGQMLDASNVRRQLENANNQAYSQSLWHLCRVVDLRLLSWLLCLLLRRLWVSLWILHKGYLELLLRVVSLETTHKTLLLV